MGARGSWLAAWRVRAGYPAAAFYLWLASPTPHAIAWGAGVAALGLVVRGAAAGHLRKHEELTVTGPYAWTRNPLYFGSALLAVGLAVAGDSVPAAAVVVAYYLLFYPAVMKREEAELRERYGADFVEFASRAPLFWPRPPRARTEAGEANPRGKFSWAQYWRNREYQAGLGFLAGIVLLWLRMLTAARRG